MCTYFIIKLVPNIFGPFHSSITTILWNTFFWRANLKSSDMTKPGYTRPSPTLEIKKNGQDCPNSGFSGQPSLPNEFEMTPYSVWHVIITQFHCTQQNSYSISHLRDTVTTLWLDSNSIVTVHNCWQHSDYTVVNIDYTVKCKEVCCVHNLLHLFGSQIYKGDPRTCAIFIPVWGSNWRSLGFPVIKIILVLQKRMSPASTAVWA